LADYRIVMDEVVGRESEIEILRNLLRSDRSELVAIYGRRRIGKTFLVREVYKDYIQFDVTGLFKAELSVQLDNFAFRLNEESLKKHQIQIPKNWLVAFRELEKFISRLKTTKKKVFFIDEFPWFATPRSNFLMAFENFWNSYATKRKDLLFVVCGSAASYMVKKLINNRGGLHNRITQKIRLLPFTLHETEAFIKKKKINYARIDILQLYMTIGGVPHYLEKLDPGKSVPQNIDAFCFENNGILVNEFNEIFASLFTNVDKHKTIVKVLSKSRKGVTRQKLLERCKMKSSGEFTGILQELIESGFVSKYLPFEKKSKDSLYRLSDEYTLFYMKYIQDRNSTGLGDWLKLYNSKSFTIWSGFSFETLCLKHVRQIKQGLGIQYIYSQNSSWKNEKSQIDLLIDRDDNIINMCEMKFYKSKYSISKKDASDFRNKVAEFRLKSKTKKNVFVTMITTFGIERNKYSMEMIQNDMDLNILFKR